MRKEIEYIDLLDLTKLNCMDTLDLPKIKVHSNNVQLDFIDAPNYEMRDEHSSDRKQVSYMNILDLPKIKSNAKEIKFEYFDPLNVETLNDRHDLDLSKIRRNVEAVNVQYLDMPVNEVEDQVSEREVIYIKVGAEKDFMQDKVIQTSQGVNRIESWLEKNAQLYQWNENKNEYEIICNFTFQPIELLKYLSIVKEEKQYIKVVVTIQGKKKKPLIIPWHKNKMIAKKIKAEYPEAYIEMGVKDLIFEKIIAQKYAEVSDHIKESYIVNFPGWFKLQNEYIYFHDGFYNCECDRRLSELNSNDNDILQKGLSCMNLIHEKEKMIPLFLFAHVGYLYFLFDMAEFKPDHGLYVFGTTNSRKTSLFKVLFNIFIKKKENQNINFATTKTGMEMFAQTTIDETLVIDDLSLTNGLDERELLEKFEYIIRLCGDGVIKRRANRYLDATIEFPFRSAVAMNGEDLPDLSQSSLLRLFIMEFNKDTVNNEVLKLFQQNPEYMQQYFSLFIRWVEKNFEDCCRFIKENCFNITERLNALFKYPRSTKLAAMLITINSILTKKFFPYYKFYSDYGDNETLIIQAVKLSEEFAIKVEPHEIYLKVLFDLVGNKEIIIAHSKDAYTNSYKEKQVPIYVGFISREKDEEDYYYLNHNKCYELVCKHCKKINKIFPVSMEKVHSELDKQSFLIKYEGKSRNGYLRKVTIMNGTRASFLCLIKSKVDSFFKE